jgi:1,2-diacylglycerol 3-alpha-glucosyltransferase
MRIGFFTDTYTPQINGVVTSIRLFSKALERQGHSVYIFAPTPRQPADGPHIVRIPSLPFVFQPEMRMASLYSQHAYTLVRRANLDVIHSHDPFAVGIFGLAMAKRFRIPYVHTYHTLYPEYVHYVWETRFTRAMAERLSRDFCDQCDLVLAPSTKIERALIEWGVTSPVRTLPTGVDAGRFGTRDIGREARLRERFGIPGDDRLLTFVGRLGKEKSVDVLIEAIAQVRTPGARLLLVGDGPYHEELSHHVAELHLEDRVTFTGYLQREDVVAAYGTSEALFFASTSETQGLVVAEAMAASLPVIAVDDLAVADAVSDGANGFLVGNGPAGLADAADRLLGDAALAARMGAVSRQRAEDLSIDNQAAKLVAMYDDLLSSRPSPRRGHLLRLPGRERLQRQLSALRRGSRRVIRRYL